jgi:hypothetical protein
LPISFNYATITAEINQQREKDSIWYTQYLILICFSDVIVVLIFNLFYFICSFISYSRTAPAIEKLDGKSTQSDPRHKMLIIHKQQ